MEPNAAFLLVPASLRLCSAVQVVVLSSIYNVLCSRVSTRLAPTTACGWAIIIESTRRLPRPPCANGPKPRPLPWPSRRLHISFGRQARVLDSFFSLLPLRAGSTSISLSLCLSDVVHSAPFVRSFYSPETHVDSWVVRFQSLSPSAKSFTPATSLKIVSRPISSPTLTVPFAAEAD